MEQVLGNILNDDHTQTEYEDQKVDEWAVETFAHAMMEKLTQKALEGRSGWQKPRECSVEHLADLFVQHLEKGDPVDLANFAMMIWNRTRMDTQANSGIIKDAMTRAGLTSVS